MATTNYGLPTFNGAEADKPIQFESTITQGFQKIDEVMKNNADAVAPVADLTTMVDQLNDRIPANTKLLPFMSLNSGMTMTAPHLINPGMSCWYNGVNLSCIVAGTLSSSIEANGIIATVSLSEGDITNIPDNQVFPIIAKIKDGTHESGFTWGYSMKNDTIIEFHSSIKLDSSYYSNIIIYAVLGCNFGNQNKHALWLPEITKMW